MYKLTLVRLYLLGWVGLWYYGDIANSCGDNVPLYIKINFKLCTAEIFQKFLYVGSRYVIGIVKTAEDLISLIIKFLTSV